MIERERIAAIIREETDFDHPDQGHYLRAADRIILAPIEPPENGEPDPEWRAIRRAIDQFAGRIPTIGKHRAVNNVHLADVVARLDAAGDREAADTIVWQAWHRALDRERERFLLADAREISRLNEQVRG
jgi:hypothetical protein